MRWFRFSLAMMVTGFWCETALAQTISLKPGQNQQQTPQLEDRSGRQMFGPLFLFACLDALTKGEPAKSEEFCTQALAVNPQLADAYKLRGYGYLLEKRFERASVDFEAALRLQPRDSDNLAGYGRSLSGLGRFKAAVVQFQKAVAIAPAKAPYWSGLCWARAGTGNNLKRALADCDKALALQPGAPGALSTRGMTHLRMNQLSAAIADYNAALNAQPGLPSALYGRGLARLRSGEINGGEDIRNARHGDAEIDDLFVTLGIISRACVHATGKAVCPAGFPPKPEKPDYKLLVVSLQQDLDQDLILTIEVGRLGLMVDQIARLSRQPRHIHHKADAPISSAIALDRMAETVTRFNALLPLACTRYRVRPEHCQPFKPAWQGATQSDAMAAADELFDHVYPVWYSLCEGRRQFCQLE